MIAAFNNTIDYWINDLERYTFQQLCTKPSPRSWSLGQLYRHLIDDGGFYVDQIKTCVATNNFANEGPTPEGKAMLRDNSFPDMRLEGAPENDLIPQPASREELLRDLISFRNNMNDAARQVANSAFNGRTRHPGLGYFSAHDWIRFADMHLRHHLKQKSRIDHFLQTGEVV